jgi:hypothetical protein
MNILKLLMSITEPLFTSGHSVTTVLARPGWGFSEEPWAPGLVLNFLLKKADILLSGLVNIF